METSSDEQGPAVFFKSAEVASISGIKASDIILGKTASDVSIIHKPYIRLLAEPW